MIVIEQDLINITEQPVVINITESGAIIQTGGGVGDMTKAVYDPGNVNDDAFDMDNMSEGAANKILSAEGKGAISGSDNPSTSNPFITLSASQKLTNAISYGPHTIDIDDIGNYTKFDSDVTISDATVAAYSDGQFFAGIAAVELIVLTSGDATYTSKEDGTTVSAGGTFLGERLPDYPIEDELSSGDTVAGIRYKISAQSAVDFTTIGAADNNVGTIFLSTGIVTLTAVDKLIPKNADFHVAGGLT